MKFSVLLPTRNRLEYLRFAVESVLRQDDPGWELVISDNAAMRLNALVNNGYAGAWPWSLNADYSLDLPGIKGWLANHAELADLPPP